jgi:SNF2 family DNA or RNA helicase
MASITIHVDVDQGNFQLAGDTPELWGNRRARFFMADFLRAELSSDQRILIPFQKESESDKERLLTQILEMLDKFKFAGMLTEASQLILKEYFEEQEKFRDFSEKARKIWNNEVDKVDFAQFTATLKERMPNRTLYDLQLLSAYHLAFSQNACNFSVPGAGKTSVVYAAYTYLKSLPRDDRRSVNKLLIIGPLSSFGPWEDEYLACFGERGQMQRLSSGVPREQRVRHFLSPYSAEITLMSYPGVASSLDDLISYLRRYENRVMVVLDEAHRVKNTDGGVWAQSVLSIAKYCKSRVILTGTPVPNGYEDIYNLYNFIWPDKDIIGFPLHQLKEMSNDPRDPRISTLAENVTPFFIRISKRDLQQHMGLPEAVDHPPINVPMGAIQREIYDLIEGSYMGYFERAEMEQGFRNALVRARLIRLLQAATNPALLKRPLEEFYREQKMTDDTLSKETKEQVSTPNELYIDDTRAMDKISRYKELEVPAKFIVVKDLAMGFVKEGKKVIIWGIFIQTIKDLQQYLQDQGLISRLLIGEVPVESETLGDDVKTREDIIREFNSDHSSFDIIIANPFAVAESISLHKACHHAIYLERNFNAANFLQSKDRIHRVGLGPEQKANYYYILAESSMDETVHRRLIEKEQSMLKIIESTDIPLINMNMDHETDDSDDIKALIADYVRRTPKDR